LFELHQTGFKSHVDVTIGICVKDSERTIERAISSVLDQTFNKKRMEIIVVDDGSRDRTVPIFTDIASKSKTKIRLCSTCGRGLAVARQMVVDNARGDFVIFVDGDMILSKDFVQKQFDLMSKNPSIGVAGGTMKGVSNRGLVAELERISYSSDYEIGLHRNWKRDPRKLGTGGSIFRLAAIKHVGGLDTQIKGAAEDADITAKIKSAGYTLFVSDAVFEHELKPTLQALWKQYAWYGYGMHYFFHKHKDFPEEMLIFFWPITFAWSLVRAMLFFKATRRRIAFLLPCHNLFRATAWWFGFFSSHKMAYGHEYKHVKTDKQNQLN
jgi:glycosyltransferase involved in cell wall biosynthesis